MVLEDKNITTPKDLPIPTELSHTRALELYLDSAVFDNSYKPMTLKKISDQLIKEGFSSCSTSAVGRWAKNYNFKKRLEMKISTVVLQDESLNIKERAITRATSDTIDRFKVNGQLIDDLYDIAQLFINKIQILEIINLILLW